MFISLSRYMNVGGLQQNYKL